MRNTTVFALNPTSRNVVFSSSGPGDLASSFNLRNWLLLIDFAIILRGASWPVDGIRIVDPFRHSVILEWLGFESLWLLLFLQASVTSPTDTYSSSSLKMD